MSARIISLVVMLSLALICSACKKKAPEPSSAPPPPAPSTTEPAHPTASTSLPSSDPALLAELGEPSEVAGYLIRPPKGYARTTPPKGLPGTILVAYKGNPRADGTSPMVQVMVATPSPGEAPSDLDGLLNGMLQGVKNLHQNWTQTTPGRVNINGMTFLRTTWSGTESAIGKGWKMHGIMYVAFDGPGFISMMTQDMEPHHEQPIKLADAALRSFRKK